MRRALLSVSDKTGLVPFATGLVSRGFELVSTGGTALTLREAGLAVIDVSEVTEFPEMMDGRLKTLHPKIHGGILARRDVPTDVQILAEHGIGLFDVVCVNLYQFSEAAADHKATADKLNDKIDIGGPTMLRAAAKNYKHVYGLVHPADYPKLFNALECDAQAQLRFRLYLATRIFEHSYRYDQAIFNEMKHWDVNANVVER